MVSVTVKLGDDDDLGPNYKAWVWPPGEGHPTETIFIGNASLDESFKGWGATISHETLHLVLDSIGETEASYKLDSHLFKLRIIHKGMRGNLELFVRSGITGTLYIQNHHPKFYKHFTDE